MSIYKDYTKLNSQYLNTNNGCNCCSNQNAQPAYSPFGIFGIQQTILPSANNFFNPFGFFSGFSPMSFSFPQLPWMNFASLDFTKFMPAFPSFTMPSFDFSTFKIPAFTPTFTSTFTKGPILRKSKNQVAPLAYQAKYAVLKEINKNDNNFADYLAQKGVKYNKEIGHKVVKLALDAAKNDSTGYCATFVSDAFENANYSIGRGHGYQKKNEIEKSKNQFTKITLENAEDVKKLPAGSVVVYQKGTLKYSDEFGHVYIATGNSKGVSDFLEQNPEFNLEEHKKGNISIYIPTTNATA